MSNVKELEAKLAEQEAELAKLRQSVNQETYVVPTDDKGYHKLEESSTFLISLEDPAGGKTFSAPMLDDFGRMGPAVEISDRGGRFDCVRGDKNKRWRVQIVKMSSQWLKVRVVGTAPAFVERKQKAPVQKAVVAPELKEIPFS